MSRSSGSLLSALRLPRSALAAALLLAACAHRSGDATGALTRAAASARDGKGDARTLAFAGFHELLVRGDFTHAKARFDQALARDKRDPYALYGQILVAKHEGHPERVLDAALALCERAPRHPLASVAARLIGELSGASTVLDEQILLRGRRALGHGLPGDAAFLLRSAIVALEALREDPAQPQTLADLGQPTEVTLLGPFSAFQLLAFDELTPVEKTGSLAGNLSGPFGPLSPRRLSFPDGRFSIQGEGVLGDGYLFAVDAEVSEASTYVVRSASSAPHKVWLDGTRLFERRSFEHTASTVNEQAVHLGRGWHRILMKMNKDERATALTLGVLRADGAPSHLRFKASSGAAPLWNGASLRHAGALYPRVQDLYEALEADGGAALATFIAVRDAMGRDRDACKALLGTLEPLPSAGAWTELRGDLALLDHTLPAKLTRGRATRDLEATLDQDPRNIPALLTRAAVALEDQRQAQAMELIQQARAAHTPVGFPVLVAQARAELQLGVDAQADQSAKDALKAQAGLCEAMALRYDLALRRDAIVQADGLVAGLSHCPSEQTRLAEHQRLRGALDASLATYERLLGRDPLSLSLGQSTSEAYVALGSFDDALRVLGVQRTAWPRNPAILKRMAEVSFLAGRKDEALKLQESALALDGSDLSLRRALTRARTGKELLDEEAVNGDDAIRYYELHHGTEDAAATYVLDAAAIRAYPDGSMVDRIHVIQKVLDQSGVQDTAEVALPAGAQVLTLRTRKADGRVLEPESIDGKETVSLPGVQVGDYVDYEYLLAHPSRGPAVPGFTASNFYFQIARIPDTWCTYTVIAPKGSHLAVDAHNMTAPAPFLRGTDEVYHQETRQNPPFIPEPESAPSPNEYLPFVSVGAGTLGNDATLAEYADTFLDRGLRTTEIEAFAAEAVGKKSGVEAVKALYAAVSSKVTGRDAGLTVTASSTLAQGRGSRLWLLKAALEAAGIPVRLAVIRTLATDPAPYRYPAESLLPYACVVAFPDSRTPLWLDTTVRFAPFGELPEGATGGHAAWLLPEAGKALRALTSPAARRFVSKHVTLSLRLNAEGKLEGSGAETYSGYEAAQLGEQLDALAPSERDQALQGALARYFGGAELLGLELHIKREVGAPLTIAYKFVVPRFGRVEGSQLTLAPLTFPSYLGRRYVQVSARKTPVYVDGSETSETDVTLSLPPGHVLEQPLRSVTRDNAFGHFDRSEVQVGSTVRIREHYRLNPGRIPTAQYEAFAQFAGEVDLVQSRDLVVSVHAPGSKQAAR